MTDSEVSPITLSYIAGFLDGDGCINLQLVRRKDYRLGYQIRPSVVFCQKREHREFLRWLQSVLRYGFVRDRKDGMSEYVIVEVRAVLAVLQSLKSYIHLKVKQCELAIEVLSELQKAHRISAEEFLVLAKKVDQFSELNFSKKRTIRSEQVEAFLKAQLILIP
jgi:LAGLIDADG endonuclease.